MLWCLFGGGGHRYAVPARQVREIVPRVRLHPLAGALPGVCGSMHYRGGWVPVVDAGLLLAGVAAGETMATRILVLAVPREMHEDGEAHAAGAGGSARLVGVLADGVTEVLSIPDAQRQAQTHAHVTIEGRTPPPAPSDSEEEPHPEANTKPLRDPFPTSAKTVEADSTSPHRHREGDTLRAIRPCHIHTHEDGTPIQCLRVADLIPDSLFADIQPPAGAAQSI